MAHSIYNTTLLPYLIADKVVSDYIKNTKVGMEGVTFERYSTFLDHKSERVFENDEHFRMQLLKAKNQRQFLYDFMYHWLLSEINKPFVPLVQLEMFNINPQLNLFK